MNLVSTMMQFLTPMIINKVASSLGMNNAMARTAISALLPTILAALAGKAASPGGAAALSSTVGQQDTNVLGSFAGMLGGANQTSLISGGTSALSSLLGSSSTNALSGALAKFSGANAQQASGLMGLLAPVILGQLAQTQKSSGLDAHGLANMLQGQKANIAAAIPAGFSQLLGGTGLLDSVASEIKAASPSVAPPKYDIPTPRVEAPAFNWMPWAIGGLAVLGTLWAFSASKPTVPITPSSEKTAAPSAPAAPVAQTAAMDQAKSVISTLTSTLGTVKDAGSAQAAIPQLNASSTALDTLGKLVNSLSPEMKAQLAGYIASAMPTLAPMIANAMKIPGVEAILKPILDQIMGKMTGLSKA
jgi:hypothetical protein